MTQELSILILTAVSVAFFHTLLGPDHYVPFIAMAKAGNWSTAKTTLITILCGIGHVGSSVVLGLLGVGFGVALAHVQSVESIRGNLAGWLLIVFGLVYSAWGLRRAYRNQPHTHRHPHADGSVHSHIHVHSQEHAHVHREENERRTTPWVLFIIFVLGPCEPLIPILMYPAAQGHMLNVVVVSLVFGIITIATMVGIALGSLAGLRLIPTAHLGRYSHALAGASIFACGLAIQFLGL
jgi:nickel/cobalt exporter